MLGVDGGPELPGQLWGGQRPTLPVSLLFLVPGAMEKYPAWAAGLVRFCVGVTPLCLVCVLGCVWGASWVILETENGSQGREHHEHRCRGTCTHRGGQALSFRGGGLE